MKKRVWWVLGAIFLLLPWFLIGGWTWARDDFFPRKLRLSAPPQGANRVAVIADSDLQGDAEYRFGTNRGNVWRAWTSVITQSELLDQKWQLLWSKDGALVALRQSPGLMGDPRLKKPLFTHFFDFSTNRAQESLDSYEEKPHSPFSRRVEKLMQQHGGAVSGRETSRDLGVWRWEDRALKDGV